MDYGYHFDESDTSRVGLLDRGSLPFLDSLEFTARDAWIHNPVYEIGDWLKLKAAAINPGMEPGGLPFDLGGDGLATQEELNRQYASIGLHFDQPTSIRVAGLMADRRRRDLALEAALARAPDGLGFRAASFLTSLAVSAIDPLNIAASFIPVVGEARYGLWAKRLGVFGARAARGAVEGAVGAAALEPLRIGTETTYGNTYDPYESFINVAFGATLGAGLHTGFGALSDLLSRAHPETREAALRSAVAQMADGRDVDVAPVLASDPSLQPAGPEARAVLNAADRVTQARARVDEVKGRLTDASTALESAARGEKLSGITGRTGIAARIDDVTASRLSAIEGDLAKTISKARRANLIRERDLIHGTLAEISPKLKSLVDRHTAARDEVRSAAEEHAAAAADLRETLAQAQNAEKRFAHLARRSDGALVTAADQAARLGIDIGPEIAARARSQRLLARTALKTGETGGINADALAAEALKAAQAVRQAGDARARGLIQQGREATLQAARGQIPSSATSPRAAEEAQRLVRLKLGDDAEVELEHAMQAATDLERQGVLDAADTAALKTAREGIAEAGRFGDAAKAAGYCLLLHP